MRSEIEEYAERNGLAVCLRCDAAQEDLDGSTIRTKHVHVYSVTKACVR